MPVIGPIKFRELIRCLKSYGFKGPYYGSKHPFMINDEITITIPNPHGEDIGIELLKRILKQAGISKSEWENL